MIVLLAVFVLMVVIGALADRSRRKKEASARPDEPEAAAGPPAEPVSPAEAGPAPAIDRPRPMKVTVRRSVKKPAPPAAIPEKTAVPVGPENAQDITARLRRAQRMYDDGLITKREYKRARRRILDSI